MSDHDFRQPLRDALVRAGDPARVAARRRARQVRIMGVAAALVVMVVVGAFLVASPEPSAADVEVIHRDGQVWIRLTDLETRAPEVRRVLAEVGLDVTVSEAPVGPSNVVNRSTADAPLSAVYTVPVEWLTATPAGLVMCGGPKLCSTAPPAVNWVTNGP